MPLRAITLPDEQRRKIALFTNVEERAVISAVDADDIYKIPLLLHEQELDDIVVDKLRLEVPPTDLSEWRAVVAAKQQSRGGVDIAHGRQVRADPRLVHLAQRGADARRHQDPHPRQHPLRRVAPTSSSTGPGRLAGMDAILVPGGFGERGIEGKIQAVRYARENRIPYLGICLGMQVAIIEYARNVLALEGAQQHRIQPRHAASGRSR